MLSIKRCFAICLCIAIVLELVACSSMTDDTIDKVVNETEMECDNTNSEDGGNIVDGLSDEVLPVEFAESASVFAEKLGAGWNLGNSLENVVPQSYDSSLQAKENYSFILNYVSEPYSGWDSSVKTKFDAETGIADLVWDIDSLESADNSTFGKFGIQIFNYAIGETGNNTLTFAVREAYIQMKDGTKIEITPLIGLYSLTMKNGIVSYYPDDFTEFEMKTGDLIGGSIHIRIEILEYLQPEISMTQQEYAETLRKNPVTTKELIECVKKAGFRSVRIPITYSCHIDEEGNIDPYWLGRIKTIVDDCIGEGLYCIINLHHDTGVSGWLKAEANNDLGLYQKIWDQVALCFQDYDEHLLFEGYNELLSQSDEWSYPGMEKGQYVNNLAQVFVDTVRKTGGNNKWRYLIISPYGALASEEALSDLEIPKDTISNHLFAEVHIYSPQDFCWYQEQVNWTTVRDEWGTEMDYMQLDNIFSTLVQFSEKKNVPVLIGEFGCWDKKNTEERVEYIEAFVKRAKENNVPYFWWDTGSSQLTADSLKVAALINRKEYSILFPEIVNVLVGN